MSDEEVNVPEPYIVRCFLCGGRDLNTRMNYDYNRKGFKCDSCLDRDFRNGRTYMGKFKYRYDVE